MSKQLSDRFTAIASAAIEMVHMNVDRSDLTGVVDYVSIYAQSPTEFELVSSELKSVGIVALKRTSGDYYKLNSPLLIQDHTIHYCRIRKFDSEHPEKGYLDFEVKDYQLFKDKYEHREHFSVLQNTLENLEMMKLRDPRFTVRAYFPSSNFR